MFLIIQSTQKHMSFSGRLSESTAISHNNVETSVFTLPSLPPGSYTLKFNIALRPQGSKAMYRKAWCWVNDLDRELIASNIALPQDWPTSKEVTTPLDITAESGPITIKAMVEADDPVELVPAEEVTVKDAYGNDVTQTQGCFWSIS